MATLNKVFLIGNLTRDPELRYIPSGNAVTTFTVATNRTYVSSSGEKKEEVTYVRVVAWSKMAERCGEYLSKGSPVFVEGRLQSRSWETAQGEKRSTIEVIAQSVQFLGKGKGAKVPERTEAPSADYEPPDAPYEDNLTGQQINSPKEGSDEEAPF